MKGPSERNLFRCAPSASVGRSDGTKSTALMDDTTPSSGELPQGPDDDG